MIAQLIAKDLKLKLSAVTNVLKLIQEGSTIPFIARYRKEMTGSLDEVEVSNIFGKNDYFKKLQDRKVFILDTIKDQGKLTSALKHKIDNTFEAQALEDIYLPYKKKRKTRAMVAIENGLKPFAQLIYKQSYISMEAEISKYFNKNLKTKEDILKGAKDIIAEWISEDQLIRQKVRRIFAKDAIIKSKVARGKKEEAIKYKDYFDFEEKLTKSAAHRILAMRRGEKENLLRLTIAPDFDQMLYILEKHLIKNKSNSATLVKEALEDSYKRLLEPSIENEFRKSSKEWADKESIDVFGKNIEQLLLASPLKSQPILAIDPGFRTGCKVACIDENGRFLESATIFPHPPKADKIQSQKTIEYLISKYNITAIGIGNGTAGQETYDFINDLNLKDITTYMVNESGASIYSASNIAREEFPHLDLTVRGAISIGRRLMDPLAELVKIDPKSIGVGQYQHDVNQTQLKESLNRVVEKCVNSVGVNVNTASASLLQHISGLSANISKNIIEYRSQTKRINMIIDLKKVKGLGPKAFELSAGFLRVKDGKNPLDNTGVHPESYTVTKKIVKDLKKPIDQVLGNGKLLDSILIQSYISETTGLPTLKDIISELKKPGLDPRGEAHPVNFDRSIKSINDLNIGQTLTGIVTNLTNFGAFVDIGIKANGLIHISQMSNKFIKDPSEILTVGQELTVGIYNLDMDRERIQLTLKNL